MIDFISFILFDKISDLAYNGFKSHRR
jgi:hypothetical protein